MVKNASTYQNDRNAIEILYFQTESRFMQRVKNCNGNSQAKKHKNYVFFLQFKRGSVPSYNDETIELK